MALGDLGSSSAAAFEIGADLDPAKLKVALLCPLEPALDGKGPAWRAAWLREALGNRYEVSIHVSHAWPWQRAWSALGDVLRGRPTQIGWSTPRAAWRNAVAAAEGADIVIAITVRALRGPLMVPLVVDHVDALSANMAGRARGPEALPVRLAAALEARLLQGWERRVAGWAAAQMAICADDAAHLPCPPPVQVVGPCIQPGAQCWGARDVDVVFSGNMKYPPNRDAALWLEREIAPAVRARRPATRILIAGRGADTLGLTQAEALADVDSMAAVLSRSRVALVPLRGLGTGTPIKMLEAAAAGAALVVTPWAHARLPLPARVAGEASGLAKAVLDLLDDEPARARLATDAQLAVGDYSLGALRAQLQAVLDPLTLTRPNPAQISRSEA